MCQDGGDNCELDSVKGVTTPITETSAYNVIYETLVTGEKDLVGQMAYCLYKQSKQQFLREFQRLNNRGASESELFNHVACSELPALGMYIEKAQSVFSDLTRQMAAEKKNEVERYFKDRLWLLIKRYQPEGFGERCWVFFKALTFGGFGGVVGNFFTTVLVLLLLFGAASMSARNEFSKSAKESLISGLAEVIGVKVSINKGTSELAPIP